VDLGQRWVDEPQLAFGFDQALTSTDWPAMDQAAVRSDGGA
jgi:hypothetical protein